MDASVQKASLDIVAPHLVHQVESQEFVLDAPFKLGAEPSIEVERLWIEETASHSGYFSLLVSKLGVFQGEVSLESIIEAVEAERYFHVSVAAHSGLPQVEVVDLTQLPHIKQVAGEARIIQSFIHHLANISEGAFDEKGRLHLDSIEEVSIVEDHMVLLFVQLEAKQEQGSVHHLQLGFVVCEANETFALDRFLQVAPLHLFGLRLQLGLSLLI